MQPAADKPSLPDYAALAFGVAAVTQVGYYFWFLYHHDPQIFAFLLMVLLAPSAIAGMMLLFTYRREIAADPAGPVAVVLTVAATAWLAALPFAFAGIGLFLEHLILEWKFYVVFVAVIVTVDQKFFPINTRIFQSIYRVLHFLLPGKALAVRHVEPVARQTEKGAQSETRKDGASGAPDIFKNYNPRPWESTRPEDKGALLIRIIHLFLGR